MQTGDAQLFDPRERLLQTLSSMLIQLNALRTLVDVPSIESSSDLRTLRAGLTDLAQMAHEALHMVRTGIDDMSLPELEGVTLAEALSRLIEETAEELGLSSRVAFSGVDEQGRPEGHTLSNASARVLYLVAREAFYQVPQHSGARRLRLTLNYGLDDVQMSIEDDGIASGTQEIDQDNMPAPPFATRPSAADAVQRGASIISDLRHLITHLGGSLEISTQGERGTRVLARVPYAPHTREVASIPATGTGSADHANRAPDVPPNAPIAVEPVRVLLVEGQAVTRAGLHRLLESYPDLQIIGEAADDVQAVSETLELGPQVVLMDAQLPNGQSLDALRQIKQLNLDTKVLLLSTQDREEYLYETLRAGADGYVLKDIEPDELVRAVRTVARGEVLIQPQLAGKLLSRFGKQGRGGYGETRYDALTAREQEVLRLLARGLRNKEIAARLSVSERTVNFHLANIYQKLNVSGRTEALSRALEQGLITA
jgi:DNA-binding NarL/FixJ family response regulator